MSPLPDYSDTQKKDWVKVKLGDVCRVDWGNTDITKKSYVDNGQFIAVSAAGCDGRLEHYEHKVGTAVISAIGARCGTMFFPESDFTAIKNTITLTPKENVAVGKFLYYLLSSTKLPKRGCAQPFIAKSDVQNFFVELPPLPEQRRIVAFLDEAFHNTTHLTEKITRSLRETQKLKNVFLHQAFTSANTAGWEYYPLEEVFTTRQGYDPSKNVSAYWENGTIPFIKMEDIRNYGQRLNKSHNYVTEQAVKTSGVFPSGSFIISTSATIGEHALVTVPFLTNRRFTCLFLKPAFEKRFERDFIFYYLYVLGQWCRRHVNSGTHAQVKMPLFRKFSFPIPPLPEQQRIVAFLDEAFTTIATLTTNAHNRLAEAQKLKNAYLQKAFESPEQILNTLTIRDPRP